MFEEEVKNLSHYDVYLLSVIELQRHWQFANAEYQHGKFEIEFKNTPYVDYYLNRISSYKNSLKNDYDLVKTFRTDVDEETLTKFEKEKFESDIDLFNKIEQLLTQMDEFLSQQNKELSI